MANETVKKRQNEAARREEQQKKAGPLMEPKNERAKTAELEDEKPTPGSVFGAEPKEFIKLGKPKYISCSMRPRDPKRKSEISLNNTRSGGASTPAMIRSINSQSHAS